MSASGRQPLRTRRAFALALVLGAHALAFWFLLRPSLITLAAEEVAMIVVAVEAPPPSVPEAPAEPEGQSAPEAPKADARPVAAPPPEVVVPPPEPTPMPPAPATGADSVSGSANLDRGGTAAGGQGTGAGLGQSGAGTGGGGIVRARRIAGEIQRADYPRARAANEVGGSVTAHFEVGADGRARNCRVVRSSGNAQRDDITCQLIERRFRYAPARDANGKAVADVAGWRQDWWPDS